MNRCPMCLHRVHLAFECTECVCELDAIEAYDAGGPDFEFDLSRGSPDRMRLEGTLEEDERSDEEAEADENEGAFDTEMDYEDLETMQY